MNKKNKSILALITVLALGLISAGVILANESSPSADSPSDKVISKIKERLEKEINTQMIMGESDTEKTYFAYYGELKEADKDTIIIATGSGEIKAKLNENINITKLKSGAKNKLDKEGLVDLIDSFLVAIGTKDENSNFTALKLSFFTKPSPAEPRETLFGSVTEVESNKIVIEHNNEEVNIIVNSKASISLNDGSQLKIEDIQIEDRVVCVCEIDDSGKTAKKILILPGKNNPVAQENQINSTQSAEATKSSENKSQ